MIKPPTRSIICVRFAGLHRSPFPASAEGQPAPSRSEAPDVALLDVEAVPVAVRAGQAGGAHRAADAGALPGVAVAQRAPRRAVAGEVAALADPRLAARAEREERVELA